MRRVVHTCPMGQWCLVLSLEGTQCSGLSCRSACCITPMNFYLTTQCFTAHLAGRNKTPARLPGASEFVCGASRSPWQLAHQTSKLDPETLNTYTFSDFTLRYFELIRRRLPFVGHSKGETAHRRKKSGQVRINSEQVDLSRSLPQGQAEHFFFVAP